MAEVSAEPLEEHTEHEEAGYKQLSPFPSVAPQITMKSLYFIVTTKFTLKTFIKPINENPL